MKIGLISINAHTKVLNCASPLHTYVFQSFLKENDVDSTIIDYKPVYGRNFDARHPLDHYLAHPEANAKKQKNLVKKWTQLYKERESRYDKFENFINKYYVKTDKCYNQELLDQEDPGFDCYMCVTDVIWKYNPNRGFDRGFFLACDCMKGKKKIAYAASRGAKSYTPEQAKEFFEYIGDLDAIAVREKSLKSYIEKNSKLPVEHVLDPVFLMPAPWYDHITEYPEKKGYVLLYMVMEKNPELVETAVRFAQKHGLEVIELSEELGNANYPKGTHHDVIYDTGVEEWLGYMRNASYIFTNSFHACCFSIIFGKQFFAGSRSGDKIDSVLELFNLSSRRIYGVAHGKALRMKDIDYNKVHEKLDQLRKKSSDFILGAIHAAENAEHRNHSELINFEKLEKDIADAKESGADVKAVDVKSDKTTPFSLVKMRYHFNAYWKELKIQIKKILKKLGLKK